MYTVVKYGTQYVSFFDRRRFESYIKIVNYRFFGGCIYGLSFQLIYIVKITIHNIYKLGGSQMNVFDNLPESIIKNVVQDKISTQTDRLNGFCNLLSNFRNNIVQELKQINVLFSEYTPHDEDNHISNLFRISDILIGKEVYEKMNAVELCLLIGAMYAHDWGMAVSKAERYYIATKKMQDSSPQINLLDDEFERFQQFAKKKIGKTEFESDEQIDINIWQEYIRNTHAMRSGKRAKEYFLHFDSSIASALDKICVGHWLEMEDISEKYGYYKDASVFGENVNVRALTIYIRLIDLFDLAEDRTPYVLWKYVNPQNCYSKMEWEKHRALHPITCSKYEKGRVICISGSTDNHEVYASLMDYKKVCERYFRECIDALAHMNDSRHELDIYLLDWRVEAINFKPIEVGFTFDKENVYRMLSDEIYNCHPYVYIRELIQNSIDAINLRKKILERKGIGGDNIGVIHFDIQRISNEEIEVVCHDDGIGMDEYILKNYFSVIGKSYYNSVDYKNIGISMPVISKFGVGILSCFAVANSMEIITKREPYMEEGQQGLRILVEDIKKTFRVEEISNSKCEVGTKIVLKINEKTLNEQLQNNKDFPINYSVINYIKYINKFIEYPIVIDEYGKKVIFLPKGYEQKRIENKIEDYINYEINNVEVRYPKEEIVAVQDLENFEEIFAVREIDIKRDLGDSEVEGTLLFPILKNKSTNIKGVLSKAQWNEIRIDNQRKIRWKDIYHIGNEKKIIFNYNFFMMCNKGIMVENSNQDIISYKISNRLFPNPVICMNFPKTISNISLSRFENRNRDEKYNELWSRLHNFISNEILEQLDNSSEYDFWKKIAINVLEYRLNVSKLNSQIFKGAKYPFINEEGKIEYETIEDKNTLILIPTLMETVVKEYVNTGVCDTQCNWQYGKSLLAREELHTGYEFNGEINQVIYKSLRHKFFLKEFRFIKHTESNYPLIQEVWEKGNCDDYVMKQITNILKDFKVSCNTDKLKSIYFRVLDLKHLVNFEMDYAHNFSYGFTVLNLQNKCTQLLIKYVWCLEDILNNHSISEVEMGQMKDRLEELPFLKTGYDYDNKKYSFRKINRELYALHNWIKKYYSILDDECIHISKEDFVEGTINILNDDEFRERRIYSL